MPERINREAFLRVLEAVGSGLTSKEVIQQSDCYIFSDGQVAAYNEEIACRAPSGLRKEFTGAVKAKQLLDMLRKLKESDLDVSTNGSGFSLLGKGKRTAFAADTEILLQVFSIKQPEKWNPLDAAFGEAVGVVQECASKSESNFSATCVHVHPEWVEAFDDVHICRWPIKTGISKSTLVRRDSIKHVAALGMTEMAETDGWVHFRNPAKVMVSCRRYMEEEFPDFSAFLNVEGEPVTLPKALGEASERAAVAASQNVDHGLIWIKLRPGKMRIVGEGLGIKHEEEKVCKYAGPKIQFLISPQLMKDIVERSCDCVVNQDKLKIGTSSYTYVTMLRRPEATPAEQPQETEQEGDE